MAGVDRTAAQALFAEAVAPSVVQAATESSVALRTIRTIPMGTATARLPVLAALPTGGFLAADQDPKPQSAVSWDKKLLTAEEIAVIIPISETAIADASTNVVDDIVALIGQEFGRIIDAAVFFGTGAPATWPVGGINGVADAAAQEVVATGNPATDMNALLGLLEANGFNPTDVYAGRGYKASLRGQTGTGGVPIYLPESGAGTFASIYGVPLAYPLAWDPVAAAALTIDDSGVVIGLRQDVTIKILEEATLTGFGNLAEKDSIAVRAVMRLAFQMADPVNIHAGGRKYPVARLAPVGGALASAEGVKDEPAPAKAAPRKA
jgi:HK97 family phage major capsid protein